MDFLIKRTPNRMGENGFALVTMMLLMVLVTAIILMALNVTEIDSNLASTNRRTTQGFHASESGSEIGIIVLQETLQKNEIPGFSGSGVVVDPTNIAGNTLIPDFVEELTSGSGSSLDSPANPDVTITSLSGQVIQVDIDYEGPTSLPGSELEEFGIGYHRKTGGTGCASGTLYYIDTVANGPMNTKSQVGSAYFNCS